MEDVLTLDNHFKISTSYMMKTPLDLGYSMGGPEPVSMKDKHYPNVHLEWPSDYDLPESGEITFKYEKTGENKSKQSGGKTRYTVDLELKSIESVEAGEEAGETEEEESGSEALDRYAKEASEE